MLGSARSVQLVAHTLLHININLTIFRLPLGRFGFLSQLCSLRTRSEFQAREIGKSGKWETRNKKAPARRKYPPPIELVSLAPTCFHPITFSRRSQLLRTYLPSESWLQVILLALLVDLLVVLPKQTSCRAAARSRTVTERAERRTEAKARASPLCITMQRPAGALLALALAALSGLGGRAARSSPSRRRAPATSSSTASR